MKVTEQVMDIIKENTASNVKLINVIEVQDRNMIYRDDLVGLIDSRIKQRDNPTN